MVDVGTDSAKVVRFAAQSTHVGCENALSTHRVPLIYINLPRGEGRNLASGATGTANIQLIAPNSMFGPRQRQIDFRVSKRATFGRYRATISADVTNLFNRNSPLSVNNTFGPDWQRPLELQQGRYLQLTAQWDF